MTVTPGRRLAASALAALAVAAIAYAVAILVLFVVQGYAAAGLAQGNVFYLPSAVTVLVLVFVAAAAGALERAWTALVAGVLAGILGVVIGGVLLVATGGGGLASSVVARVLGTVFGLNLIFWLVVAVATPTVGRLVRAAVLAPRPRTDEDARVAFVRLPAASLADGITTHIERVPVDDERADEQWDAYVGALRTEGFRIVDVDVADDLPDSVFVEDAAVIVGDTAVITRPGDERRRAETSAVEDALRADGYDLRRIEAPGRLDGGDVLQVGSTVYVGRGGRTDGDGIRQLRAILSELGRTVVTVPVTGALHLKSAVTALPDGTVIGHPSSAPDPAVFARFLAVPEPEGAHVVVLDAATVLLAASAPRTAELLADLGYRVVTVDIGEFEKLEGCVTCLSVRGV